MPLDPYIVDSKKDLARLIGVPSRTIESWFNREDVPGTHFVEGRKRPKFNATIFLAWYIREKWAPEHRAEFLPAEQALTVQDQIKQIELIQKQIDLAERREELIPTSHVEEFRRRSQERFRATGELLANQFGQDAQQLLNDAIDVLQAEYEKLYK